MSRHAAIDLEWAGGSHTFRLGLEEIEELEASVDMSIFLLLAAMSAQVPFARLKHYSETIRLGLIGGGAKPIDARMLVKKYVDERPLAESVALGEVILRAAMERVFTEDLEPGEQAASKSNASTSAPSTVTPS